MLNLKKFKSERVYFTEISPMAYFALIQYRTFKGLRKEKNQITMFHHNSNIHAHKTARSYKNSMMPRFKEGSADQLFYDHNNQRRVK